MRRKINYFGQLFRVNDGRCTEKISNLFYKKMSKSERTMNVIKN